MAHSELNLCERRRIEDMLNAKISVREIAAEIGRHVSTIYRDIKRNDYTDTELPELNGYYGVVAQRTATQRRARRRKLVRLVGLRKAVIKQLKEGPLSSLQAAIAGQWDHRNKSPVDYILKAKPCVSATRRSTPMFMVLTVSPESWLVTCPTDVRNGGHIIHAGHGALFSRQIGPSMKGPTTLIPARRLATGPPGDASITCQLIECDLMIFERAQGKMNVASLVERKTRFAVLFRNNDRSTTHQMNRLMGVMEPLPQPARKSITFDRGIEFRNWRKLKPGIGTEAWFCDPQAPWQKGSVENLNKRARRYLPRDSPVAALSNRDMKSICDRLNSTPRKCLGWRTPTEAFREELMKLR
jgi:IS30 family transposase